MPSAFSRPLAYGSSAHGDSMVEISCGSRFLHQGLDPIACHKIRFGIPKQRSIKLAVVRPIYLDNHAHAQLDKRVASLLADSFERLDANPHSIHEHGTAAHQAVERARDEVASLIDCTPGELIFTSGATEANNLAIGGLSSYLRSVGRPRLLVGAGEHPSVLEAADHLSGGHSERVPLKSDGKVDLQALETMLGDNVGIVSVAAANHEIGTVQDIKAIAERVHRAGALLHSDLAQAGGWIRVRSDLLDVASLSSHKLGGPVGIGALYIRRRHRRHLAAQILGGGQEHGARSGTVSAPLCAAFGAACTFIAAERGEANERVAALRDRLLRHLHLAGGLNVNGGDDRLPGNLNISFDDVDGEALVLRLRNDVSASTGSACTSHSLEPSHVLLAIGLDDVRARGAIRLGLGKATTATEIDEAAEAIVAAVHALRSFARRAA